MALIAGCTGSGSSDLPKTYPVSGVVTHEGKPVDGATVTFLPMEGTGSSIGLTDANGKYALSTFNPSDGAPAGQYKVSVVKWQGGAPPPAPTGQIAPGEIDEATYAPPKETPGGGAAATTGPKNLLPAQYSNADSSGLRATVAEAENQIDLPLK
jgi:hypothetical protein